MLGNDKFTKRTQEENTPEFKKFKKISDEDRVLVRLIKEHISPSKNSKILDVGGREGYISLPFARPENITIVDPDPVPKAPPGIIYIQKNIQDVDLGDQKFDLIITSHVWGDLQREEVAEQIIHKLYDNLALGGSLFLCYNSNTGFMTPLSEFAKKNLKQMRWDYFDENLLESFSNIKKINFITPVAYESFEEMGRFCWVLFATAEDDILETAKIFTPFLKENIDKPQFDLEQTLVIINP